MKTLIKSMIRAFILHFNKNEREFSRLLNKYGSYERYKSIQNLRFFNYTFCVPDARSFIWQFKEIFVDEIYKFETKNTTPVIFDIGSNVGTSVLYFSLNYPQARIIAFEADPNIARICSKNLLNNGVKNVEVINKAVWVDCNGIEFSIEGADGGSIKGGESKKTIETIRLREYLAREEFIDFLKIDIEGAEYEVLLDCAEHLSNVQNIFVEYHSWSDTPQKLSDILKVFEKCGFRYYIQDFNRRKNPLVNHGKGQNMDLQLNIFGVKIA